MLMKTTFLAFHEGACQKLIVKMLPLIMYSVN